MLIHIVSSDKKCQSHFMLMVRPKKNKQMFCLQPFSFLFLTSKCADDSIFYYPYNRIYKIKLEKHTALKWKTEFNYSSEY